MYVDKAEDIMSRLLNEPPTYPFGTFLCIAVALIISSSSAKAEWGFDFVNLDVNNNPGSTAEHTDYASADAGISGTTGDGSVIYSVFANTSANVPIYTQYSAHGEAYTKMKCTFHWNGGGTPTSKTLKYKKVWNVTPASSGSSNVGPYATASFDGTPVTTTSGTIGYINGFSVGPQTPPNATLTYSTGSTAKSGYSYGYAYRSSSAEFFYDFTNL